MSTRNPAPGQPEGSDVMEPGPQVGTDQSDSLLGGSIDDDEGPAGVPQGLIDAAKRGDALDAEPGNATGLGGMDDALSPSDASLPQSESAGRGEGAGHRHGGASSTGRP